MNSPPPLRAGGALLAKYLINKGSLEERRWRPSKSLTNPRRAAMPPFTKEMIFHTHIGEDRQRDCWYRYGGHVGSSHDHGPCRSRLLFVDFTPSRSFARPSVLSLMCCFAASRLSVSTSMGPPPRRSRRKSTAS